MSEQQYTDEQIAAAAQILYDLGVGMFIYPEHAGGCWDVEPDTIVQALRDEVGWLADIYGVTKERYEAWRQYYKMSETVTCLECGAELDHWQYNCEPQRWVAGVTDHCPKHQKGGEQ